MKGLLRKDFMMTVQNRSSFLVLGFICVVMSFSMETTFLAGYTIMVASIMGLSTLSRDMAENNLTFLMTLPVRRETYVREKFVFCFLMDCIGLVVAGILMAVTELIRGNGADLPTNALMLPGMLPLMFLMVCSMLAIEIRFGAEKSRIVMFIIYGGIALIVMLVTTYQEAWKESGAAVFTFLLSLHPAILILAYAAVVLILCFLLYRYAVRTMEKKEF